MVASGERIKLRRAEKGLSLAELARRADISKGYLHSIESGETRSPSAEILFRIATELGTTIADLLGEESVDINTLADYPAGLKEFAENEHLTQPDIDMLKHIQYRGSRPESIDDWKYIYESIKRTLR